ncbi:thiamine biosynthesis protein ThiS [Lactobacillus sp. PFC-70]|uniref:sulfur carrier protein ThiS n=1 Tax=Levilactobacillus namurensis TaxID=380393 RepID=UPI0004651619|nr:sulfur carrier protein ThiS [Levilactobacillus namurensis]PTM22363.1 thiamine biosynthesis protein ThiS [Lactobacillus sp. PFC-70]
MLTINGEPAATATGTTILALLTARHTPIEHLVVEVNGQIIHHTEFATTTLQTDDQVEIITFVGGGR